MHRTAVQPNGPRKERQCIAYVEVLQIYKTRPRKLLYIWLFNNTALRAPCNDRQHYELQLQSKQRDRYNTNTTTTTTTTVPHHRFRSILLYALPRISYNKLFLCVANRSTRSSSVPCSPSFLVNVAVSYLNNTKKFPHL